MYRPSGAFTTRVILQNPTHTTVKGVQKKEYKDVGPLNCLFKTYGGTESTSNDVLSVVETANIETWYRPDITSGSRIQYGAKLYEVMGDPEDIEERHQYLKFKVRRVHGGA